MAALQSLLELREVHKSFPGVQALRPLSFAVERGEVLGLVGENGAGKSTLIKVLSGVYAPDGGEVLLEGRPVRLSTPHDALEAGVATIHQELSSCGHLSVAENLLLGERWPRLPWGAVDWRRLHAEAALRLMRFELAIPTRLAMSALSAAEKQEVAMARALSQRSRLLILDEPT
ncbi:MAG: sugar ABC transporter ATP-binding protein, partial [Planctomycetes bacterium]|nr:sugar ABC transporter ATP-binding protein [Planctomycetota bacterium]